VQDGLLERCDPGLMPGSHRQCQKKPGETYKFSVIAHGRTWPERCGKPLPRAHAGGYTHFAKEFSINFIIHTVISIFSKLN
jgi:hypothetical protein